MLRANIDRDDFNGCGKKMYVPVNAGALMADGFLFAAFPVLIGTILMLFRGAAFRKAPEATVCSWFPSCLYP